MSPLRKDLLERFPSREHGAKHPGTLRSRRETGLRFNVQSSTFKVQSSTFNLGGWGLKAKELALQGSLFTVHISMLTLVWTKKGKKSSSPLGERMEVKG